ncbi:MAG TPA: hypothetical protein VK886_04550 [Vicinamibacterales bacterium]|nr:hypothetical protein [Vicinamibacterales bacterium]
MDRPDERRDQREDRHEDEAPARPDSTLGIHDANPPRDKVPGRGETDRALDRDRTERPGSREVRRAPDATSIDMGAGGSGTEVERD